MVFIIIGVAPLGLHHGFMNNEVVILIKLAFPECQNCDIQVDRALKTRIGVDLRFQNPDRRLEKSNLLKFCHYLLIWQLSQIIDRSEASSEITTHMFDLATILKYLNSVFGVRQCLTRLNKIQNRLLKQSQKCAWYFIKMPPLCLINFSESSYGIFMSHPRRIWSF